MENPIARIEAHKKRVNEMNDELDLGPTATALELLQAVYRSPSQELYVRMRAAMACLPFETPKLAVTAQITEQDFATLLDRRLKRIEEMKLLEANGAEVIDAKPQVETKPALARTNDRRFRRF
jgi:hypothetical protein